MINLYPRICTGWLTQYTIGLLNKSPKTCTLELSHYAANYNPNYGPASAIKLDRLYGPTQPARHVPFTNDG